MDKPSQMLNFRAPHRLAERLRRAAKAEGTTMSALIIEAVTALLDVLERPGSAPNAATTRPAGTQGGEALSGDKR